VPIHTTKQADQAGVLGVAVLTGVGLGMYPDVNVIRAFQTVDSITYPVPENVRLYEQLRTIFIDSQEALTEIDHRLASLYL